MSSKGKAKIFQFSGTFSSPASCNGVTEDKTMQCSELEQHIDDRLDDQLSGEERAAMDAHLAGCASCRSRVREEQALREMLSDIPVPAPSAGFAARELRQALEVEAPEGS
jgi:anti-sigma factor RsiW